MYSHFFNVQFHFGKDFYLHTCHGIIMTKHLVVNTNFKNITLFQHNIKKKKLYIPPPQQ